MSARTHTAGVTTVAALVAEVAEQLARLDDAVAEARELVAALLDAPRHWPALHADDVVEAQVRERARRAASRRAAGAPLAYAVGRASFRALTLVVDERVLIPRPETELLVDLVLARRSTGVAVDVGTGSGAIAIALATEGRYERVLATDVSKDALRVARANTDECRARVELLEGDLLAALDVPSLSVVVSNPPYIALGEAPALPASVRDWEPPVALYSSGDGLALTGRLVRQAAARLEPGGLLALEVDARRASLAAELVSRDDRWEHVNVHLDLAGRERFVLATRKGDIA